MSLFDKKLNTANGIPVELSDEQLDALSEKIVDVLLNRFVNFTNQVEKALADQENNAGK